MKTLSMLSMLAVLFFISCNSSKPITNNNFMSTEKILQGTYWKLVELNSIPVGEAAEGKRKEIFIFLNPADNRVSGVGGCNGFGGKFKSKTGGHLTFSSFIRTQMACKDLTLENNLFKVLEETDSYLITKNELQLSKINMGVLAKFVAVPEKKHILEEN